MVKGCLRCSSPGRQWRRAIGENIDKEGLGGWEIQGAQWHRRQCREFGIRGLRTAARRFLSYLPANSDELPPVHPPKDDPKRRDELLIDIVPKDGKTPYKPRKIIEAVFDKGSFFEIGELWGRSVVTGFARLNGHPVAVIGGRSVLSRRRMDGGCLRQSHPPCRSRRDVPPADHPSGRLPRLCGRREARKSRRDAQGRSGDGGGLSGDSADLPGGDPQGVWAGRLGDVQSDTHAVALLLAVGRLGQPADGGRHRGGLQAPA